MAHYAFKTALFAATGGRRTQMEGDLRTILQKATDVRAWEVRQQTTRAGTYVLAHGWAGSHARADEVLDAIMAVATARGAIAPSWAWRKCCYVEDTHQTERVAVAPTWTPVLKQVEF